MNVLRIVIGALAALMALAIIYAWRASGDLHPDFLQSGQLLLAIPWGQVTLLDLYVSFALIAVVIALTERNWLRAALWIAPLPLLGSLWGAVWLAFRLPMLAARLSGKTG